MIKTSTYSADQLAQINALPRATVTEPDRWWEQAECRNAGADPNGFYLEVGHDSRTVVDLFCSRCPVRDDCLQDAIDRGDTWGIWGGLTPVQRQQLTQKPRAA